MPSLAALGASVLSSSSTWRKTRLRRLTLPARTRGKSRSFSNGIEALAREAVPPLILREALGVVKPLLFGSVALPGEKQAIEKQP
jgi:hypothetical protein